MAGSKKVDKSLAPNEGERRMPQNDESWRSKRPEYMKFDDFLSWAVGYIVFGIGQGDSLRSLLRTVLEQAALNTVWGGCKPKKRPKTFVCRRASTLIFSGPL